MTPAADQHGNRVAREGVDRCACGSKYWEHDRCVDCGAAPVQPRPCWGCGHTHDPDSPGACWEAACAPSCTELATCPQPYRPGAPS